MAAKYKPKKLKFFHICTKCLKNYESADVKGTFCPECKKPKNCICGCSRIVKTPGKEYARGCKTRGKTYIEIYGTSDPGCGFGKGVKNPMSNLESKLKQSYAIKNSYTYELREKRSKSKLAQIDNGFVYGKMKYTNDRGEKFRSRLEFLFSNILQENNISYEYEKAIYKLPDNIKGYKRKIVDFRINNTLIEISGLAYMKWVQEFVEKINLLKQVTDCKLVILTYGDRVEFVQSLRDSRTFIYNLFDLQENFHILNKHLI